MDDNTAQKKRARILKASADWELFTKQYGIPPQDRQQFLVWAIAKGVDPTYWWNTRVMAQSLGAHPSSPSQPHQEQVGQPDAGGHGGSGVVGAIGMAAALLSQDKPELMEDDEEYKKIENNLIKAKGKTKKEDFTTVEELDYLYGSPTDPSKPSLQNEAEKEFREKHPERAKKYDQKKTLVYKNPNEDPAVIQTKQLLEAHTTKRLAYLDKTGTKQDKKNAIKNRIEERTWVSFAKRYPEKAVAYAKDNKQIRIAQTTAQEVEKITQQPPPITSGFTGQIETPLPFSSSQIPPQPSQPPPPTAQPQQQEPGGGQSASRAGQAFRKWRAAQAAAKKAEGQVAEGFVKKAFWTYGRLFVAGFGILMLVVAGIMLLEPILAPPGGTGGIQIPGTGGDIASCTFYRGGDTTQGYKFRIPEWPALINDVSSKVGVPASIVAGILRVETPINFYTNDPTFITNDYDDHFSQDENGNPVAYGVMQFTPGTFKGTFEANRAGMQSLFGKTEASNKLKVGSLADVEPSNLLRIYSVRDSVIATAFKVKTDKKSINGNGPWDETTVREIAKKYFSGNNNICNYNQNGRTNSYCDDLWKSYSGCVTSSAITACATGTNPSLTVEEITIGQSFNDHPIRGYKMGNGSYRIAIVGGMNGTPEAAGTDMVDVVLDAFKNGEYKFSSEITLYFLPMLNPDSKLDGSQDWNGNDVDINRNFDSSKVPGGEWNRLGCSKSRYQRAGGELRSCGDGKNTSQIFSTYCSTITDGSSFYCAEKTGLKAFSEPETQAIRDFIVNNQVKAVFSYRAPFNNVTTSNAPSGSKMPKADELAQKMATWLSIPYEPYFRAYPVTGQFMDWLHDMSVIGIEVELPKSPKSDTAFRKKNLEALQNGLNFLVPNNTSSAITTSCASSCPLQGTRTIGCGSFMSDPKYNRGACSGPQPIDRGHCGLSYGCYKQLPDGTPVKMTDPSEINNTRRAHSIDVDGPADEKVYLPTINGNSVTWNYEPSLSYSVAPSDGGGYGHVFSANTGGDKWILHLLHTAPPPLLPIPNGRSEYQSGDGVTTIAATGYTHVHINLGKNPESNRGGNGWLNPEGLGMCAN